MRDACCVPQERDAMLCCVLRGAWATVSMQIGEATTVRRRTDGAMERLGRQVVMASSTLTIHISKAYNGPRHGAACGSHSPLLRSAHQVRNNGEWYAVPDDYCTCQISRVAGIESLARA